MNLTLVGHWREIILVLIRYILNSIGQGDRKFLLNDFVLRLQIYLTIFFFQGAFVQILTKLFDKEKKVSDQKNKIVQYSKDHNSKRKKKKNANK